MLSATEQTDFANLNVIAASPFAEIHQWMATIGSSKDIAGKYIYLGFLSLSIETCVTYRVELALTSQQERTPKHEVGDRLYCL